jgi:protein TonB
MNFSDVMIPIVQEKPTLLDRLTAEASHHPMVGLLAILVLLLHLWVIVWLSQPSEPDTLKNPPKVMEVALLSAPSPKPAVAPPAPPKPVPPKPKRVEPKKVQPKKPPVKQPVKKKMPVVHKSAELPKPQPVVEQPLLTPSPLSDSAQKTEMLAPTPPQPAISQPSKPAEKAGTAEANSKTIVSGIKPLVRVPPKYPARAANRHIEGWVKIEFTITTDGTVSDAVVVEAEPADVFDDAALSAIEKWKFKEKLVNGIAVTQRAVQVLKFKLSK